MYAIVKCGGKQLKIAEGDTVVVERLSGEKGEKVVLDEVLMIADGDKMTVGTPLVEGASVEAEVLEQKRDDKVIVFKKKRRHNYRRKKGHRQYITVLKVKSINAKGGSKKTAAKADAKKTETKAKSTAKADAKSSGTKAKSTAQKSTAKASAKKAASK